MGTFYLLPKEGTFYKANLHCHTVVSDGDLTPEQVKNMTLQEKMDATRKHREAEYERLIDAVYPKRGWTLNGVPTVAHLKELGMDLPELLEVVEPLQDVQP